MTSYIGYAAMGLAVGLTSALLGIGGGAIFVPIALFFFAMPFAEARAASLAFIVPIALIGALRYRASVNMKFVALALPFGILGVELGVRLGRALPGVALKRMFGILMLLVGLKMVLFPGGWEEPFKGRWPATAGAGPATAAEVGAPETTDDSPSPHAPR